MPLERLRPVAGEWGTLPHPLFPEMASGPYVCPWGPNGNPAPNFWPDNVKIITEEVKAANPVPQGLGYASTMTNCFVVAGEYLSEVGLWARRMTFYHWLEYAIPAKAHAFTAELYVTDDAAGYCWWRVPIILSRESGPRRPAWRPPA